ncbi:C-terminal binding protein [Streptomyces turgidiscabies]|uniref:Glyoxylate reductase family protein n=1 Tax=Streptomyces turgidiscabies (strain Car8) TaxID=698760 RepID=L7F896_STRT8|nr:MULTISPECIES: C-terminal binding protein [Streptomyces]ELP67823.1 glyoxylate reductase family protein [Streptomyces turgidiscabies Car8]MDX3491067.1 C-terminal binding protein [Streptomyces turgidiscabies]GAQ72917.1 glycerate dehydrogenase [Streptomyces turgidiscabies]
MKPPSRPGTVLLTDHAWPDDSVERSVVEEAGHTLVTGPADPVSAEAIEELVAEHRPDGILTCWAPVSATAIGTSPDLRIVARLGVGLDNIAVDAATERGVWVTNVPDYCVEEVSDHAVGMVLAWTRGLAVSDREVRAGRWNPAGARLRRLSTLTCGVVGHGRIGRATVRKLRAFGCRILAHDPHPPKDTPGVEMVGLEELLRRSDVVILHVPLTPGTHHVIGAEQLALMSPGGLLVNVSRGGLVDTDAVIKALDGGHLDGAAFDVLESEPHVPAGLLDQPGALLTPHIAFSSDASVTELRRRAAEEVVRILADEAPAHACNAPRGLLAGTGERR